MGLHGSHVCACDGGYQNYGPFLGYPKYQGPYYNRANRDPKRDHNFDNSPDRDQKGQNPQTMRAATQDLQPKASV